MEMLNDVVRLVSYLACLLRKTKHTWQRKFWSMYYFRIDPLHTDEGATPEVSNREQKVPFFQVRTHFSVLSMAKTLAMKKHADNAIKNS